MDFLCRLRISSTTDTTSTGLDTTSTGLDTTSTELDTTSTGLIDYMINTTDVLHATGIAYTS